MASGAPAPPPAIRRSQRFFHTSFSHFPYGAWRVLRNPPRLPEGNFLAISGSSGPSRELSGTLGSLSTEKTPETEMLTPKGEHSFPCSTRVMFDGRIIFDGIATAKNFGSWILFPIGSQVKKKSGLKFSAVSCS